MTIDRRQFIFSASVGLGATALAPFARASAYPARLVRVIVLFAPGGPTDLAAMRGAI